MDKVHVYTDSAGEFRWRRVAANGQIVAAAGEGFERRDYAELAAMRYNPECELVLDDEEPDGDQSS